MSEKLDIIAEANNHFKIHEGKQEKCDSCVLAEAVLSQSEEIKRLKECVREAGSIIRFVDMERKSDIESAMLWLSKYQKLTEG